MIPTSSSEQHYEVEGCVGDNLMLEGVDVGVAAAILSER